MTHYTKKCKICGKIFIATQNKIEICYDESHTLKCVICGEEFQISRNRLIEKDHRMTCSRKCTIELRKRTNQEIYGGNAPASSQAIKDKIRETNLEKFGTIAPAQNEEVMNKIRNTNLERYGVESYFNYKDFREQSQETCLERYGFSSPMKCEKVKNKVRKTVYDRYGGSTCFFQTDTYKNTYLKDYIEKYGCKPYENPINNQKRIDIIRKKYGGVGMSSQEIRGKILATNVRKYGTENVMQNPDVVKKAQDTCLSKYGNRCYLQSDEGIEKTRKRMFEIYGLENYGQTREAKLNIMTDPSKIDNLEAFNQDPVGYVSSNYGDNLPTTKQLAQDIGICESTLGVKLLDWGLTDLVSYVFSYMEHEVYEALIEIDPDLNIERNTKRVITPYELDLYLPDYKLGIECNPTSTHNSSINSFNEDEPPTSPKYHKMKSDLCEEKAIFLFHIFGYDWTHHQDVIVSMLRNILGKNENKIYGRNCEVMKVSSQDSMEFLNENHRQGGARASIRLGLYFDDELVSLMTFGKMRQTIGTGNEDLSDCYELIRFCNKQNTSVVGGASKLFSHFLEQYSPGRVRSFSDRAHTKGTVYEMLGFHEVRRSDPGYVWVQYNTDRAYHRINAQKQNIKEFLKDDTIDLTLTERQIMESHGYVSVYDSGSITWEYV